MPVKSDDLAVGGSGKVLGYKVETVPDLKTSTEGSTASHSKTTYSSVVQRQPKPKIKGTYLPVVSVTHSGSADPLGASTVATDGAPDLDRTRSRDTPYTRHKSKNSAPAETTVSGDGSDAAAFSHLI